MTSNPEYHLHMVSDATGETLETMVKAGLVQFQGVKVNRHFWPLIRTTKQMENVLSDMRQNPGLVMYTLVNQDLTRVLRRGCQEMNLPIVSLLDPMIKAFGDYFHMEATSRPGQQYVLDQDYFNRIDAVQFSLAHDDGQLPEGLKHADIVLIGVSRTSKTPTSMYLANRGYKTANVPFVAAHLMPEELSHLKDSFVVGLTATPDRLVSIRTNRLRAQHEEMETDYVNPELVMKEIQACRRFCSDHGWTVIDVTRRSIEETAAAVINLYQKAKAE